jgi:hypothetical protein
MNALERLGLDSSKIGQVISWIQTDYPNKPILMRFQAEDSCTFVMEQEVEMNTGISTDYKIEKTAKTTTSTSNEAATVTSSFFNGLVGGSSSSAQLLPIPGTTSDTTKTDAIRTKVITKVREYHWKVSISYHLIIFVGGITDSSCKSMSSDMTRAIPMIELQKRSTDIIIITPSRTYSW